MLMRGLLAIWSGDISANYLSESLYVVDDPLGDSGRGVLIPTTLRKMLFGALYKGVWLGTWPRHVHLWVLVRFGYVPCRCDEAGLLEGVADGLAVINIAVTHEAVA